MFQTARAAFAVALTAIALPSGAQTAAAAAADPQAASGTADPGYRSPFEGYQRFTQEQVGSWKAANDNVGRIGGWREYAKEARPPAAPVGAPPKPHAGHGRQ